MPTKREREYYRAGFIDGQRVGGPRPVVPLEERLPSSEEIQRQYRGSIITAPKKRKLSAWNKYVKNKRNHITYRDGKLNLKKMAVAFRRKKRR